jgi:hypothetical protein
MSVAVIAAGEVGMSNELSGSADNAVQAGTVHGGVHFHASPQAEVSPPVVVGAIPREPKHFQPRTGLVELNRLADSGGVAVICPVSGGPGIGKTQLAAAYARQRVNDGWPIVAWIPADTQDQMISGLAALAVRLGFRGKDPLDAATQALSHLNTVNTPALMVFDNVADLDAVAEYLPATGGAQIVITSRKNAEEFGDPVPVDVFTVEESLRFLHEATGVEDDVGAAKLTEELGGLPLALTQAAGVIKHRRLDYAEYMRLVREYPLDQHLVRRPGSPYPRGTPQAIMLSLEDVGFPNEQGVTDLLRVLAVLSPDGVPRHLLSVSDDSVDPILDILVDASVVALTEDGRSVTMHRLVQRVIRDHSAADNRLEDDISHAARVLNRALMALGEAWHNYSEAEEVTTQIDVLWRHRNRPIHDLTERLRDLERWALQQLDSIEDL